MEKVTGEGIGGLEIGLEMEELGAEVNSSSSSSSS